MLPLTAAAYDSLDLQQFYTDAEDIRSLMQWLLGSVDGLKVLEPCAGRGAFLAGLSGTPSTVDAVDIDERHTSQLRAHGPLWLNPIHADFIDLFVLGDDLQSASHPIRKDYDAVICNPPYGLRFSIPYRRQIKKCYPHLYARESYGLFLYFAIESLRAGGRYVFIIPDTFLTSRNHTPLREFLIREGRPTHIVRFPSKRFESVNFGYGHLCVIAGNRAPLEEAHTVVWVDNTAPENTLSQNLFYCSEEVTGAFLMQHLCNGWVQPAKRAALELAVPFQQLGSLAHCKTGIYTGNNVQFCAFDKDHPPPRISNGHTIVWSAQVCEKPLSPEEQQTGLAGLRTYVPFVRGGHRSPFARTAWALDWSKAALQHYAGDKKARLQNSQFYFRRGLAVPMVTSGRISASLMEAAVFDQGVVGVFPHHEEWLEFLLVYLNSGFVSHIVKAALNPGANNSASYIKRIPVPPPSPEQLAAAQEIIALARSQGWENTATKRETFVAAALRNSPKL